MVSSNGERDAAEQGPIEMDMAADLPLIMGDRVHLQQVVLNLILNGIEAMSSVEDRPQELVVKTRRGQVHDEESVAVQDSGIGLDSTSIRFSGVSP